MIISQNIYKNGFSQAENFRTFYMNIFAKSKPCKKILHYIDDLNSRKNRSCKSRDFVT